MRVYTTHLRPDSAASDRGAVLVKEGFCWPGFLFGPIWALCLGLWSVAAGLVVATTLVILILEAMPLDDPSKVLMLIAFQALVGTVANDLRRWTLARRGFAEAGVVAATDLAAAERRFFESRERDAGAAAPPPDGITPAEF